eukprot:Colp12_sorted_trinity150504_noHs@3384
MKMFFRLRTSAVQRLFARSYNTAPAQGTNTIRPEVPTKNFNPTKPDGKKPLNLNLHGVFAIHKPVGFTSADAVNVVKRIFREETGTQVKVGHGGTLDKDAEGVLVLGIGQGCRILPEYLGGSKGYRASGLLGEERDTYDASGEVVATSACDHVTESSLKEALASFVGESQQTPPVYSALKHNGKRLSDLARAGKEVDVAAKARSVTVYTAAVISCEGPKFEIELESSSGFYVRSLVHDLGLKLGTHAHMTHLLRTKQGDFKLGPESLKKEEWTVENIKRVLKPVEILPEKPEKKFSKFGKFSNGQKPFKKFGGNQNGYRYRHDYGDEDKRAPIRG